MWKKEVGSRSTHSGGYWPTKLCPSGCKSTQTGAFGVAWGGLASHIGGIFAWRAKTSPIAPAPPPVPHSGPYPTKAPYTLQRGNGMVWFFALPRKLVEYDEA